MKTCASYTYCFGEIILGLDCYDVFWRGRRKKFSDNSCEEYCTNRGDKILDYSQMKLVDWARFLGVLQVTHFNENQDKKTIVNAHERTHF